MSHLSRTALSASLAPHLGLSKSRLETLAVFLIALVHGRTVNLSHVASQFPGAACWASNYRRLQRFFQHVRFDQAIIARLMVAMLDLSRPKCLALDRTNWKVGSKHINILVLAIVTRRFRVPLLWSVFDHQGNSNCADRIELLRRYLALFEPGSIELLLGDREFIGAEWIKFLIDNNIAFAIRAREELRFARADGTLWSLTTLLRRKRTGQSVHTFDVLLPETDLILHVAAKRIKDGEWLIVLTNSADPKHALRTYKRRWAVECLFADAKTRGLNLEDTHLTIPAKIETLLVLLALAITWTYRCATQLMGMKAIRKKTHGRRYKSWFRIGLDALRNAIANRPSWAANAWLSKCPIRPINV
jgi:Transposase DDE domain